MSNRQRLQNVCLHKICILTRAETYMVQGVSWEKSIALTNFFFQFLTSLDTHRNQLSMIRASFRDSCICSIHRICTFHPKFSSIFPIFRLFVFMSALRLSSIRCHSCLIFQNFPVLFKHPEFSQFFGFPRFLKNISRLKNNVKSYVRTLNSVSYL